jgi:translation initiation factor 1
MPCNIFGEWIPEKEDVQPQQPVKVRLVKRGKNLLTVIHNLYMPPAAIQDLASSIKRKLGCGGAIKENEIEIQGDKVQAVLKMLHEKGIKAS